MSLLGDLAVLIFWCHVFFVLVFCAVLLNPCCFVAIIRCPLFLLAGRRPMTLLRAVTNSLVARNECKGGRDGHAVGSECLRSAKIGRHANRESVEGVKVGGWEWSRVA